MGIRKVLKAWANFALVPLIAIAIYYFHIPLLQRFDEMNRQFPANSATEQLSSKTFIGNGTHVDFLNAEKLVYEWHESLWQYRSNLITQVPLVDMDDEEDFEIEIGTKDTRPLKNRSPWLTAHLFIHILLLFFSHIEKNSKIWAISALISQAILLVLFLQGKRLADNVSNAVSVVRRASRIIGTQVPP